MREFETGRDYHEFAKSVTYQSRYVFEPHVEAFIQTVIETGVERMATVNAGGILYRAQLGYELEWHLVDPEDPEGDKVDVPGAFPPARMKPPRDAAREGRVNPKGIPCLYLADEQNTAMAETPLAWFICFSGAIQNSPAIADHESTGAEALFWFGLFIPRRTEAGR